MGSACLYGSNNFNKDVSLEDNNIDNSNTSKKPNKSSNQLNTEGKDNKKSKMSQIIDYFNEEEAEIVKEYNKMKKTSKNISKKNNNEKYELMLRRLLDQQNIKMIGPKRRRKIFGKFKKKNQRRKWQRINKNSNSKIKRYNK